MPPASDARLALRAGPMARAAPSMATLIAILRRLALLPPPKVSVPPPVQHEGTPLVADDVAEVAVQGAATHVRQTRKQVTRAPTEADRRRVAPPLVAAIGPNVEGAPGVEPLRLGRRPPSGGADQTLVAARSPGVVRGAAPGAVGDPRRGRG